MKRGIRWGFVFFWLSAFLAQAATGATLSGRLTTSAHSWQVREVDGTVSRHLRAYQVGILNASRLGGMPLSFHTYAQVSGDLLDDVPGRGHYRILHAYLRWKSRSRPDLNLSAGRQRIHSGVGFGTIDGVRLGVRPCPEVLITGYAGILVPVVSEGGIGTWDEGHLWGGQALFEVKDTSLGISFAERAREATPYDGSGTYSGLLPQDQPRAVRRLGVDLRQTVQGRLEVYGRVDLDLEDQLEVDGVEVVGHLQATPELRISGEFQHRKPRIHVNSILSVFEVSTNREAGGRIHYRLSPRVSLSADAFRVVYDDDDSWRLGVGVLCETGYIGYSRRVGYGGASDAVSVSFHKGLTPELTIKADGSFSGYRLYAAQADRDRALAGSLGLTYRPRRALSFDVTGQVLRNKYYTRDVRFFFRGSVWFFKRSSN